MEQKAPKAPTDPNFPRMLFHPECVFNEWGPTKTLTVGSKEEMDKAMSDGWLDHRPDQKPAPKPTPAKPAPAADKK